MSSASRLRTESALRPLDWIAPPEPIDRELIRTAPETTVGDRPPLLFVHGTSMGAWCWQQHWMPAAANRGWDCWAVSLRGHGESAGRDRRARWMYRDYVHDVLQAVTELPAPPVLVGHSMGSIVVERVAARYPAAGVVSMGPAGGTNGLVVALQLLRHHPADLVAGLLGRPVPVRPEYVFSPDTEAANTRAALARMLPPTVLNQFELLLSKAPEAPLCPIRFVGMERDTLIPPSAVERYARQRGEEAIIIPRGGHTPHLEPDHWQTALDITLATIESMIE